MAEPNALQQAGAILYIHAQTALHPGSGTALGVVDLPVQRERHTQWPIIPGSSLKGVCRDTCRQISNDEKTLFTVFGPDTDNASDHAGAISFTDARLLAFPVRSLKGVFAWVTCRVALERLHRDLVLIGQPGLPELPPSPDRDKLLCAEGSPLLIGEDVVVLEEFELERIGAADAVINQVAESTLSDGATKERLRSHLAILSDDHFTHFARHATEIMARIGLDPKTKTVKKGALFYQEYLPPETLMCSVALANPSRNGDGMKAPDVLGYVRDNLDRASVIQIGGDETIGKGLCSVHLTGDE